MIELRYKLSPWHVWRISHYYRFAVCCTPRCGSQSVMRWFAELEKPQHVWAADGDYLTKRQRRKVCHEYTTFALIRDPWSRMVSAYLGKIVRHQRLGNCHPLISAVQELTGRAYDLEAGITFRQFVIGTRIFTDDHWRPCVDFLEYPPALTCTPVELPDMIANVTVRCQMPVVPLPRDNVVEYGDPLPGAADAEPQFLRELSAFPAWQSFYDDALADEIAERYKEDINRFGLSWQLAIEGKQR